jgi:hypothetical protein
MIRSKACEVVNPNPKLIEYFKLSKSMWTEFDGNKIEFLESGEWHYILSNIEQNIFLLKRLEERNLLESENHIVDCGIGLGTALYDIYLQSKDFTGKSFTFTGIEKQKSYLEFFNKHLISFWEGNLNLIEDDIMNRDYSKYNIIYTYTPFQTVDKLKSLYNKIISEIEIGSVIIENKNSGLGLHGVLTELTGIEKIQLDDIVVFKKL